MKIDFNKTSGGFTIAFESVYEMRAAYMLLRFMKSDHFRALMGVVGSFDHIPVFSGYCEGFIVKNPIKRLYEMLFLGKNGDETLNTEVRQSLFSKVLTELQNYSQRVEVFINEPYGEEAKSVSGKGTDEKITLDHFQLPDKRYLINTEFLKKTFLTLTGEIIKDKELATFSLARAGFGCCNHRLSPGFAGNLLGSAVGVGLTFFSSYMKQQSSSSSSPSSTWQPAVENTALLFTGFLSVAAARAGSNYKKSRDNRRIKEFVGLLAGDILDYNRLLESAGYDLPASAFVRGNVDVEIDTLPSPSGGRADGISYSLLA